MTPLIGATKLKELTADQVDEWLEGLTGKLATRSLQGVHAILKRAIRQAQARDKAAPLVRIHHERQWRPVETIADLVGHASTAVTEEVYRHQLKPVITRGAETMNTIFKQNQAKSA